MLTDEQCMKFRQMPGSFNEMVRAIYAAGINAANTLPHRVMFDRGIAQGRKEAAEEIIWYILDQGKLSVPRTGDDVYFIVDEDIEELRKKYL